MWTVTYTRLTKLELDMIEDRPGVWGLVTLGVPADMRHTFVLFLRPLTGRVRK